ncbi:hypothetical protein BOSEA31B_14832 [Hyphomicrobiales bacterium]|nr:hypothetical protein BOSEA31B_14832 [Hyphomicrobiales bacterium]CAH1701322.1 hypothetical protein BOSEA1005_21021 [Hyphomicrobiales bacterium]
MPEPLKIGRPRENGHAARLPPNPGIAVAPGRRQGTADRQIRAADASPDLVRNGVVPQRAASAPAAARHALDLGADQALDHGRQIIVEPRFQHRLQHVLDQILEGPGIVAEDGACKLSESARHRRTRLIRQQARHIDGRGTGRRRAGLDGSNRNRFRRELRRRHGYRLFIDEGDVGIVLSLDLGRNGLQSGRRRRDQRGFSPQIEDVVVDDRDWLGSRRDLRGRSRRLGRLRLVIRNNPADGGENFLHRRFAGLGLSAHEGLTVGQRARRWNQRCSKSEVFHALQARQGDDRLSHRRNRRCCPDAPAL